MVGSPDLARFFAPRRVAIVGASEDLGKFGGRCIRRLIDFGFQGEIYPINPGREEIFGLKAYPSIDALPQVPDHVGIVLPAAAVEASLLQCVTAGVPFATVFSAGFGETGTQEGRERQQRLVDIARGGGLRFMGPNCNGVISYVDAFGLTSTVVIDGPRLPAGDIAIASQSGGAGHVNIMWRAQQAGLRISYQVTCGNDADLDLIDYMRFMVEDERTRVVLALAERFADGGKLLALAERAAQLDKPIVMVKVGRSAAGSRAAASHTGSITGEDAVTDAVLRHAGIIRVDDCNELYETAILLRRKLRPTGRRAAAASISGGNLVMLADLGGVRGIDFPPYGDATQEKLKARLPGLAKVENPTDMTAAAFGAKETFADITRVMTQDDAIDVVIPVVTVAPAADLRALADISAASEKPVVILWSGYTLHDASLTPASLVGEGHAVYRDALACLKALDAAARYADFRASRRAAPPVRPSGIDAAAARRWVAEAGGALSEAASKRVLACYGLPVMREALARDADEAARLALSMGGPLALKAQSPDLPHKTEAGAVRLNVQGADAARAACREIVAAARAYAPEARIEGVLVQEMVSEGHELLIGISRDATFGPILTVGFGGVYVEVLKDVTFLLPPFGPEQALAALRRLRGYAVLEGVRGQPRSDLPALADAMARLSWLAADLAGLVGEVDVNPVRVLPQGRGLRVIDALIVPR